MSYFIEFALTASDGACCQSLEWDVVLFDKDVDCVTAYLKQFGGFSDAEEVLLKKILASCFFCVLLFEELFLCLLSGFVCKVCTSVGAVLCAFLLRDEFFSAVLTDSVMSH